MLAQGAELHLYPAQITTGQLPGQGQKALWIPAKGGPRQGYQQQWIPRLQPIALQQAQFPEHGIGQLFGIIGQVKGALLQHRRQESRGLAATAVEPADRQGGQAPSRGATEPQGRPSPQSPQGLRQPGRRLHSHAPIPRGNHGHALPGQGLCHGTIARHQGDPHLLATRLAGLTPATGIQVAWFEQSR